MKKLATMARANIIINNTSSSIDQNMQPIISGGESGSGLVM